MMKQKIEQAKKLLKELDKITDHGLAIKARKMLELQEALVVTRKQLGISC